MSATAEPAADARRTRLALLGVLLLALLPSVGTLSAPWIAEDSAILAQVRGDGPWADWGRPQYDMQVVLFWRPLVSTSWALQEATSGIAPLPLRLFNVGAHALVALLVAGCALRLRAGRAGAFLAGAWVALAPEQGGAVTWLAGRTDLLCALFLAASAFVALGRRPGLSAPLAFLACAAKEFGFLAPLWSFALVWARGEDARGALRRALPALLGASAAFVWRARALGGIAGGYPAELPGLGAGLLGTSAATLAAAWPSLLALACLVAAGAWARTLIARVALAASALALASLAPLYPLLADGALEPENQRLLYVAECALGVAVGAACCAAGATRARAPFVLGLAVLAVRLACAWSGTHAWAESARAGEEAVARARASVAAAEPRNAPVLFADFPRAHGGANCLGFGLAARFRAPFPESPRPVWPWWLAYVPDARRERAPLVTPRADGSLWPLDDPARTSELVLTSDGDAALVRLVLDERALLASEDRSQRIHVRGAPSETRLEGVLFTELGYEPFTLASFDAGGAASFTLMQLLASANGVAAVAELVEQTADLGGRDAFLELRAVAADGAVRAASRWIELAWPPELRERARGR